jgi:hypothetical protein
VVKEARQHPNVPRAHCSGHLESAEIVIVTPSAPRPLVGHLGLERPDRFFELSRIRDGSGSETTKDLLY